MPQFCWVESRLMFAKLLTQVAEKHASAGKGVRRTIRHILHARHRTAKRIWWASHIVCAGAATAAAGAGAYHLLPPIQHGSVISSGYYGDPGYGYNGSGDEFPGGFAGSGSPPIAIYSPMNPRPVNAPEPGDLLVFINGLVAVAWLRKRS